MAKRKVSELQDFDPAEYLTDDEACRVYLNEILNEGDLDLFISALGDVAKAKGMTKIAEESGLGRESLYKALAAGKKPQFETVFKVARAAGLKLQFA